MGLLGKDPFKKAIKVQTTMWMDLENMHTEGNQSQNMTNMIPFMCNVQNRETYKRQKVD